MESAIGEEADFAFIEQAAERFPEHADPRSAMAGRYILEAITRAYDAEPGVGLRRARGARYTLGWCSKSWAIDAAADPFWFVLDTAEPESYTPWGGARIAAARLPARRPSETMSAELAMTESIQRFTALVENPVGTSAAPAYRPLMLLHFALAGGVLLLAALALLAYLYTLHFTYLDIGWDLRFSGGDDLYAADVQILFGAAVVLGLMSLIQFSAFRTLAAGSAGALRAARAASVVLLLGFPLAYVAWRLA